MPTRICNKCGLDLPQSEFRLRRRGGTEREGDCRRCHNKALCRRRERLKLRRLRHDVAMLTRAIDEPDEVHIIVRAMLRRLRGVDGLVRIWATALEAAMEQRPGSAFVLQSVATLVSLQARAESESREFAHHLAEEVRDNPIGLAEFLRGVGWRVELPWELPAENTSLA